MNSRSRLTRLPGHLRTRFTSCPPTHFLPTTRLPIITTTPHHLNPPIRLSSSLPRVADTSIWTSIIPKFLRNRDPKTSQKKDNNKPRNKEWNPATFFIFIFLLIGSQAIRMIGLRNDFANFNRSADAKMELLRDVIARLEKGEKVDVEKLIGAAGAEGTEREWEEVLQEIEKEDSLWRKSQGDQAQAQETQISEKQTQNNSLTKSQETSKPDDKSSNPSGSQKPRPFTFYQTDITMPTLDKVETHHLSTIQKLYSPPPKEEELQLPSLEPGSWGGANKPEVSPQRRTELTRQPGQEDAPYSKRGSSGSTGPEGRRCVTAQGVNLRTINHISQPI